MGKSFKAVELADGTWAVMDPNGKQCGDACTQRGAYTHVLTANDGLEWGRNEPREATTSEVKPTPESEEAVLERMRAWGVELVGSAPGLEWKSGHLYWWPKCAYIENHGWKHEKCSWINRTAAIQNAPTTPPPDYKPKEPVDQEWSVGLAKRMGEAFHQYRGGTCPSMLAALKESGILEVIGDAEALRASVKTHTSDKCHICVTRADTLGSSLSRVKGGAK